MLAKLRVVFALGCALALSWPGSLAAQVATPVASPEAGAVAAGSLRAQMDPSVDPGEDFFRYATGGWQVRTTIPADEASYGITQELRDLTIEQLLTVLERLAHLTVSA